MIYRSLGHTSDVIADVARTLAERQPRNPFFAYLVEGSTPRVRDLTLELCPSDESQISVERFEWAWERADTAQAWRQSMLWDCVFMAGLLARP